MNRQQKSNVISDLQRMVSESQAMFLINYKGMSVSLLQGLRKNLRTDGSKLRIAKASLMYRATQELPGVEQFSENLKDQIGIVFVKSDISGTAKHLVTYAKEHANLTIVAGYYESKILSSQDLAFLASLPSREVLLAQLAGTMQAPITSFVRVLHLLIARLAYVLKEIENKQQEK